MSPIIISREKTTTMDQRDPFEHDRENRKAASPDAPHGLSDNNNTPDEDLIELTDVIKKGAALEGSPSDFKFEKEPEQADDAGGSILVSGDDNLDEIIAGLETEFEMDDIETGDKDHDNPASPPQTDAATQLGSHAQGEEPRPSLVDLDETPTISVEAVEEVEGKGTSPQASDDTPSISEERIEAILTPVIKDVVERTVRETVAEVAERVIKETIESLKDSLEPPSE
jgi:hypothetical protein